MPNSTELCNAFPRTHHLASTIRNSWPPRLHLNLPLPFLCSKSQVSHHFICVNFSKRISKEKKKHNHDSIISPKKKNPYFLLSQGLRANLRGRGCRPTSVDSDTPRKQPTSAFSEAAGRGGPRRAGVRAGLWQGTWGNRPVHFM